MANGYESVGYRGPLGCLGRQRCLPRPAPSWFGRTGRRRRLTRTCGPRFERSPHGLSSGGQGHVKARCRPGQGRLSTMASHDQSREPTQSSDLTIAQNLLARPHTAWTNPTLLHRKLWARSSVPTKWMTLTCTSSTPRSAKAGVWKRALSKPAAFSIDQGVGCAGGERRKNRFCLFGRYFSWSAL